MTNQHEIKCPRNAGFRITRHDYVTKQIILKIDHNRHPRPVDRANLNLPDAGRLLKPDIEFQIADKKYVLDVTFAVVTFASTKPIRTKLTNMAAITVTIE